MYPTSAKASETPPFPNGHGFAWPFDSDAVSDSGQGMAPPCRTLARERYVASRWDVPAMTPERVDVFASWTPVRYMFRPLGPNKDEIDLAFEGEPLWTTTPINCARNSKH